MARLDTGGGSSSKRLFVTGLDFASQNTWPLGPHPLIVRYNLPLGSSKPVAFKWPPEPPDNTRMLVFSPPDYFSPAAATTEGLYLAGWNWSQTHGEDPKQFSKGVLVQFPLEGPTGPGVGGCLWLAQSDIFKPTQTLGGKTLELPVATPPERPPKAPVARKPVKSPEE